MSGARPAKRRFPEPPPLPDRPAHMFPDLPIPAEPFRGCCRCRRPSILVLAATGQPYCSDCWTEWVIKGQLA